MIWKFFRSIPGVTAYYEPLHQELLQGLRFRFPVLERHYGVSSYFDEYERLSQLEKFWSPSFARYRLYLAENDDHDELKSYIQYLLDNAPGIPVMKFNRICFRLPWIRKAFPQARVVHLYRNVRDEWMSNISASQVDVDADLDADVCYLKTWSDDLVAVFPFLSIDRITHPYQRFYFIWKLSCLVGQTYADINISYENWVSNTRATMQEVLERLQLKADLETLYEQNPVVRHEAYAGCTQKPEEWYVEQETRCDETLKEYGLSQGFRQKSLEEIRNSNPKYVSEEPKSLQGYIRQLLHLHRELNARMTEIYEKQGVIEDLSRELQLLRQVAQERLQLINRLTDEIHKH